jgi:type I restriction enzyme M protein
MKPEQKSEEAAGRNHGSGLVRALVGLFVSSSPGLLLANWKQILFENNRSQDRLNEVPLDASREYKTGRAQNELLPEHVTRIHGWYYSFKDVEGIARVVTLDEIAANDQNHNIPRYVEPKVDQETLTVGQALKRLKLSAEATFAAEARLVAILQREGLLK